MDPDQQRLAAALHTSQVKCVLAVTGGGASALAALLAVPGASRTILECLVPYHDAALSDFLGFRPEHSCSIATAHAMARRAFERAERLASGEPVFGLGCTASLATDRPKRGDHRFHIALLGEAESFAYSLTLTKGARDREGEEQIVAASVLNTLAEALNVPERLDVPFLPVERPEIVRAFAPGPLAALRRGEVPILCQEIDGRLRAGGPLPPALLCGSFNPLHDGHVRLAEVVAGKLGAPVAFELSAVNADKPPLAAAEVRRRLRQFVWRAPVWLSRAPTFAEKAQHFSGTAFVVGADTAARIVAPRFYGDSVERMHDALTAFRAAGCRFVVAGRADASARFVAAEDVPVPEQFRDLFTTIAEAEFRHDRSSTQLREQAANV
jgi:hypothetical protein